MKKKVLVIANFTKLPNEEGNSRFPYLCNLIDKKKFDVELITSTFYHALKKQRDINEKFNEAYKITLIKEPGYAKNISIKRFLSHKVFAKNVARYLKRIERPDVIYCAVPSLDVAEVAGNYAQKNSIKFIIDIQDLWPEAFKMVFKVPIISDIIFKPMEIRANKIYSKADIIVAVSKTYANRAKNVNNKWAEAVDVYLGTDLDRFDEAKKIHKIEYNDEVIRLAYIGTLGHSYDIKCVIDSIKILNDKGFKNILFEVMGDGPLKETFEAYAKEKEVQADFAGRLAYEEMVGKLCACDIAVNPIVKGSAGSIINKVGDYAAAGLPVVNTQECNEYRDLVQDYEIGFNVECGDSKDLADKIEKLYKDKSLRERFGKNNRELAEKRFDRKTTYIEIKELIED